MCVYLSPLEVETEASIEYWRNLEIWVRGRSRSIKMVPIDRSYRPTTLYWSAIVTNYSSILHHFRVIYR